MFTLNKEATSEKMSQESSTRLETGSTGLDLVVT